MLAELLSLLLMLIVILVAAEVFTNALEHLGDKLKISEGVTGSLFAAVGTALPETLVPILAIFGGTASGNTQTSHEIGVGAILGAPLMLSTLSVCLMTLFAWRQRGGQGGFLPERSGFVRDLNTFLIAFALAAVAMFIPHEYGAGRLLISAALVLLYFVYVMRTLRASASLVDDGHATEADSPMFLAKFGLPTNWATILLQLAGGLALLVFGAHGFIQHVDTTAQLLGVSALLLSLMIVPIATELPEKINSILWIRKHKDTLAFGNITGAMVFQGTLLPALGIALTPWNPQTEVLAGVLITFAAAAWLRLFAHRLKVWHLLVNGGLYAGYLAISLS